MSSKEMCGRETKKFSFQERVAVGITAKIMSETL